MKKSNPLSYLLIMILLESCYYPDKKISFKVINVNQSTESFLKKKLINKGFMTYLKQHNYRKYCIIKIENTSKSDIYFYTCDSILKPASSYVSIGGEVDYGIPNLYTYFGKHKLSKISKGDKAQYFFLYKTQSLYDKSSKIDTVRIAFSYIKSSKNISTKMARKIKPSNITFLVCKLQENKNLELISSYSQKISKY